MANDSEFDFLFDNEDLFGRVAKEHQESAEAVDELSVVIDETSETNLQALDSYTRNSKSLNEAENVSVDNLQRALDNYQELSNASVGQKLANAFASFTDPSKSRKVAADNLQIAKRRLLAVDRRKAQLKSQLATTN